MESDRAAQYRDGIVTRRNTFQKFYDQQELQQYIEDALDSTAVPVALGVFYVFRDPAEQQDFLSARSRRAIDWPQISARLGLGGPRTMWKALYDAHKELLGGFGKVALALGRFPARRNGRSGLLCKAARRRELTGKKSGCGLESDSRRSDAGSCFTRRIASSWMASGV